VEVGALALLVVPSVLDTVRVTLSWWPRSSSVMV
jgi:hypothetical protein